MNQAKCKKRRVTIERELVRAKSIRDWYDSYLRTLNLQLAQVEAELAERQGILPQGDGGSPEPDGGRDV